MFKLKLTCDCCKFVYAKIGVIHASDVNSAVIRESAEKDWGWSVRRPGGLDHCPMCAPKFTNALLTRAARDRVAPETLLAEKNGGGA